MLCFDFNNMDTNKKNNTHFTDGFSQTIPKRLKDRVPDIFKQWL